MVVLPDSKYANYEITFASLLNVHSYVFYVHHTNLESFNVAKEASCKYVTPPSRTRCPFMAVVTNPSLTPGHFSS